MSARSKFSNFTALLSRQLAAFGYLSGIVLPVILRTGRRPVIFSRYTGMGDIICTIPAVKELQKRHPGATFIYNCHPDFTAIPRLAGMAGIITTLKYVGLVGYWYRVFLGGFYHFSNPDFLSESGKREPMVVQFLQQFNLPVSDKHPQLPVTPAGREKALAILAGKGLDPAALILIHPGPSWTVKEWPRENWTRLVAELRARGFTNIGQLGVGRYMNFGQVEVAPVPGAVSLLDAFTVEECIAAIAQARLLVGIDSGPLHMAAATGIPCVGIFGPTDPAFLFPADFRKNFVTTTVECAGCEHRKPRLHWVTNCPYDIRCMKQIPVEEVLQACLAKLQQG